MLLMPSGVLEQTALWQRLAATAVAVIAYFVLTRKNLFVGVITSALVMYLILFLVG
jgi:branched-subunit amino acid transport protein